jgi:hypothetical protein
LFRQPDVSTCVPHEEEESVTDSKKASGLPLPEALAGNFQDAARWFNQLWTAGADPTAAARAAAGAIPSMMMPTLDVQELEKRIADLRSVEHWLELNLSLLRTTIQGLDMQRSTLAAWQGLGAAASNAGSPGSGKPFAASAGAAGGAENPAFQPALWWNALQQQFAQMAASAVAKDAAPESTAPAPATPGAKASSGKTKS